MLTRKYSQARIFDHPRIGRAWLTIEQRHFAKKIAALEFSQRHFVSVLGADENADLPLFDHIHCIAFVTSAEQDRAGFAINALEQFTQFVCRLIIERLEQRHLAQRFDVHLLESDGTVVTIAAMRAAEKRQLSPRAMS